MGVIAGWEEASHVLECNGAAANGEGAAALTSLDAFFGALPAIRLLPPHFPNLVILRLVHQVM